jgi:hypothetical protein
LALARRIRGRAALASDGVAPARGRVAPAHGGVALARSGMALAHGRVAPGKRSAPRHLKGQGTIDLLRQAEMNTAGVIDQ